MESGGHVRSILPLLRPIQELRRESYSGMVHNFQVDVDESYVADGVVVHNCLCFVITEIR
jgi:hypothetical protein